MRNKAPKNRDKNKRMGKRKKVINNRKMKEKDVYQKGAQANWKMKLFSLP